MDLDNVMRQVIDITMLIVIPYILHYIPEIYINNKKKKTTPWRV